jgi:flagellar hook-basal body complex protein FliE
MALPTIGGLGAVAPAKAPGKESFGKVLEQAKAPSSPKVTGEVAPKLVQPMPQAKGVGPVQGVKAEPKVVAAKMVDQVATAQKRLDHVLAMAESGKTFTPAELLAFQAQVSQASQQLDLAGKVVEKAVSGVKQILQTQI